MDKVDHIDIQLLTKRNYPISRIRLIYHVIEDINNLVDKAQLLDPTVTEIEVVRAIWRHGSRLVRNNLAKGIGPRVKDLPPPAIVPEKPDAGTSDKTTEPS